MKYKIKYNNKIIAAFEDESDRDVCLEHLEDYYAILREAVNDDE
jgi:hypothetical protein